MIEGGEPLQSDLNEAARSYRQRCEPLPPSLAGSPEVIWLVGLPGGGKSPYGRTVASSSRSMTSAARWALEFGNPGWVDVVYAEVLTREWGVIDAGRSAFFGSTGSTPTPDGRNSTCK